MHDLVIHNALVFSGLDEPPKHGDVAISDGRVAKIAQAITEPARENLDAAGLWLTPGFVDIHTHYDIEVEISPGLHESVRHGVTTVVMGNCSLSLTVGDPEDLADIFLRVETLPPELVHQWMHQAMHWQSPRDYFNHLNQLQLGPNVSALLGHSTLRAKVMGLRRSLWDKASKAEIMAMQKLACEALEAGCIGISVDMVHWHKVSGKYAGRALPSHHAKFSEYKMLADVCRQYDAVFQVTPNPENFFSFVDVLRLSLGFFRPPLRNTILSALDMYKFPQLWRIFPFITFVCNRLLNCNIRFQTLAEAFTIYADGPLTPLFEEFPAGVLLNSCRNNTERLALWRDKNFLADFKKQWRSKKPRAFHRDLSQMTILKMPVIPAKAGTSSNQLLIGKTFTQAAQEKNQEPLAFFCELLATYDEQIRWVASGANHRPAIRERLMSHPHILPGFSDAGAHSRHLAFFDSALSLLRQAVTTKFISPQKAIKRVTSEPAQWFNLKTGVVRPGAKADLVLLRPEKLVLPVPAAHEIADPLLNGAMRMVKRDPDPAIAHVYIAGKEVVRNGEPLAILGEIKTGNVLTSIVQQKTSRAVHKRYRDRINDELWDHPFNNYWDIFVLKHQNKVNIYLHCLAVLLMYCIAATAVVTQHIAWVLLMPVSQFAGLIGHYFFERSNIDVRDTIFSWRAFISLHKLLFAVITNNYTTELTRVRRELSAFMEK